MNIAHNLLDDLTGIGATIEPAGDRLILRAGPTAIPATLVSRIRRAKLELMAALVARKDSGALRTDDDHRREKEIASPAERGPDLPTPAVRRFRRSMAKPASRSIRAGPLCMVWQPRVGRCQGGAVRY